MSDDEDAILIARIRQRDEGALGKIYDRYNVLIYTLTLRIIGNRATAEEATQDVFLSVWRSIDTFQDGGSIVGWLIGIARHRAIDLMRAQGFRRHAHTLSFNETHIGYMSDGTDELTEAVTIRAALQILPINQYQVIALAYYSGFTQDEIATYLHVPLGTTKTRMRSGLLKLRELLYVASEVTSQSLRK